MFLKEKKQDVCSVNSCIFWFRSVMSVSLYIGGAFCLFFGAFSSVESIFSLIIFCVFFCTILRVTFHLQLFQNSSCPLHVVHPVLEPLTPAVHAARSPSPPPLPLPTGGHQWCLWVDFFFGYSPHLVFNGKEIILSMRVLVLKGEAQTFAWKMDTVGPA